MKVYIVFKSSGSHEDYSVDIHKVFASQEMSQSIVDKKNAQIKRIQDYSNNVMIGISDLLFYKYPSWKRHYKVSQAGQWWVEEEEVIPGNDLNTAPMANDLPKDTKVSE